MFKLNNLCSVCSCEMLDKQHQQCVSCLKITQTLTCCSLQTCKTISVGSLERFFIDGEAHILTRLVLFKKYHISVRRLSAGGPLREPQMPTVVHYFLCLRSNISEVTLKGNLLSKQIISKHIQCWMHKLCYFSSDQTQRLTVAKKGF